MEIVNETELYGQIKWYIGTDGFMKDSRWRIALNKDYATKTAEYSTNNVHTNRYNMGAIQMVRNLGKYENSIWNRHS